jgi:superfamily I DNA and/or RNA helicase/very-short-patch-repair endonuclease
MKEFTKSILNYFATYTETRFSFQKKAEYKWTDNGFTVDFSVFPEFQKKILTSIKDGEPFCITVKKNEYSISLDQDFFKNDLLKMLDTNYGIAFMNICVDQVRTKLMKTEGDKVILFGDGSKTARAEFKPSEEFERKVFIEGLRVFNLAFRNAIRESILSLQSQKKEQLQAELRFSNVPLSSLNPNGIEQDLFDHMQEIAKKSKDTVNYQTQIRAIVKGTAFDLKMYDLYAAIRKFTPAIGIGSSYLFFHEISMPTDPSSTVPNGNKYPIFLTEVEIKEDGEEVTVKSSRDIVIINTPAINSFALDMVLTTPRAARFVDASKYLGSVERYLQNIYDLFDAFLLTHGFKSLTAPNRPSINFRVGLQVMQNENRKLLDYSELITHIDAGKGDKLIDFIESYVSGNVTNTTDEVDTAYRNKYPRKSVDNLLSSIPIPLNKPQKRILTALENDKNRIIVVDGPPGTGKSHTIAAVTYWGNQNKKSVVITSHKKAALDVIDRMLTDKFKQLHPKAKPSVLRISEDETGINTFQNSLSGPVIAAANNRVNQFNEEAVNKDAALWREKIDSQVNDYWKNSSEYKEHIASIVRLEQLQDGLVKEGIIKDPGTLIKLDKDVVLDMDAVKAVAKLIDDLKVDRLSLKQLAYLYERRELLPKVLSACNILHDLSMTTDDMKLLHPINIDVVDKFASTLSAISSYLTKDSTVYASDKPLKYRFFYMLRKFFKIKEVEKENKLLKDLKGLEYDGITHNIALILHQEDRARLTLFQLQNGARMMVEIKRYMDNRDLIFPLMNELGFEEKDIKGFFHLMSSADTAINKISPESVESLNSLTKYFPEILGSLGVDIDNVKTIRLLFLDKDSCRKAIEYINLSCDLSKKERAIAPEQSLIKDYYSAVHKQLEHINDERLKNLNNYSATIERIIVTMKTGKRLKLEELKVLLDNVSCIVSEPDLISKYFPMEEDSIDVLIIDEASQVSIAESISLILRAKKIVVFGDELQYGAVSAGNVSEKYASQYFKEILNSYASDYKIVMDEREKEALAQDASRNVDDDDSAVEPLYKPEEGTREWLKTFSIRTSTLSFAKAIKNYGTSLDIHFRSFPEIIGYSNEFFYKISQIPLVVNRIRTKPIGEVLRFIKVETQGNSGRNVNLDEIEAIKQDIQTVMANGFKGTIGIITSFREQKTKMEEVLRKELPNYHFLERDNKFTIWFVGDVQGEERDIVYYSFVQDKKLDNADLRTIYPTIGGTADNIRKLKMQRLNVGFSRAKDTMVFVHSMPVEEYSNTRLGDALKFYANLLNTTTDNYIKDEAIFGSPAEKDLYTLIVQTDFYNKNRDKIKIIAQFPIGEYIETTLHKYIPKYRVDFLLTISEKGQERSLILEYDGVEYHTKNPEIVTAHNFSQEYLDYDIERQLELESYGYRFLRINKFTLTPKTKAETKITVLSALLEKKFDQ